MIWRLIGAWYKRNVPGLMNLIGGGGRDGGYIHIFSLSVAFSCIVIFGSLSVGVIEGLKLGCSATSRIAAFQCDCG